MLSKILIGLAVLIGILIIVTSNRQGNIETVEGFSFPATRLLLMCGYLVLVGGAFFSSLRQQDVGQLWKYACVWLLIGGVLAIVYQVTH